MKKQIKIIFFGDSISVGQYVSVHKTWVGLLSKALEDYAKKHGLEIVTALEAVNGRTTRQALEAIPMEVQQQEPDIVVVQYGMNDCNHWQTDRGLPRVSPDAFLANIKEIVIRCKRFGAKAVFLNTNHPTGRNYPLEAQPEKTYQEWNERYNGLVRKAAASFQEGVLLNDMEYLFEKYISMEGCRVEDLVLPAPDLLHLNEKGHELYFETIYRNLVEHVLDGI